MISGRTSLYVQSVLRRGLRFLPRREVGMEAQSTNSRKKHLHVLEWGVNHSVVSNAIG
jgi:hypothetical protein